MIGGKRVLAVVPARAGSKGVADKNMRALRGLSLIGWAARVLKDVPGLDARIISTDSVAYAEEGKRHGLEAPFMRPAELSTDGATAADTMVHALRHMDAAAGQPFDIVLVVEPTSPLRLPSDITGIVERMVAEGRDSMVAVSALDPKWHPRKAFRLEEGRVLPLVEGVAVTARQQLDELYWRNGVCYAVGRDCLLNDGLIIGKNCGAAITGHAVVNIDSAWEFDWAEFLLGQPGQAPLLKAVSPPG